MMLLLSALLSTASAQEEVCDAVVSPEAFSAAIDKASGYIEEGEIPRALRVLEATKDVTHCMKTLISVPELARFAQTHAVASFFNQEEAESTRWGRLVELLEPGHDWGEIGPEHPVRELISEAGKPPFFETEDGFVLEPNGAVFIDGKFGRAPQAHGEVPHLVQVFNGKGHLLLGRWQDGDAFPNDLVGPPVKLTVPKYFDPVTSTITPKGKPPGDAPPRKPISPLVVVGASMVGVSAVLYGIAGLSHAKFRCNPADKDTCPTTPAELTALRSRTNVFVLAAGASFLGGVGLGVTGLLTEEAPGIRLNGRF